jgi:hypothetical protein
MVNYTKHQHISTSSATTSTLGLVDGTDKIHTGIIKALELAAAGTAVLEYGGSVFQQTAGSTRTQFGVSGAIKYMREGLVLSSTPTAVELTADPDVTNDRYDMIVIQSSDNNFAVRVGTAATVPRVADNLTAGDIPVALVKVVAGASSTKNATTREVQLFGFDKTSNSLSVGYSDSGVYTESMSIQGTSSKTTFHNKVADADIRFVLGDNTADEKFEIVTDDDADGDLTDTVTEVFSVDGTGATAVAGTLTLSSVAAAGTDTDKFLVLDGSGNVDYRTGAQTLSDIGGMASTAGLNDLSDVSYSSGDLTITSLDKVTYSNGNNAELGVAATAHNVAGKNLTIEAGTTTAGTTNNIAGGSVTIKGGAGKGSGAGGDIIFQTANAGASGSSINSHATALTISDDLSATFAGSISAAGFAVTGSEISGPTDGSLTIKADTDLIFRIDSDSDGTESFQFKNGANTEIASLSEAGLLQIDGDLDVDGTGTSTIAGSLTVAGSIGGAGIATSSYLQTGSELLDVHSSGHTLNANIACHYLHSSGGGTNTCTLGAPVAGTLHYIKNVDGAVNIAIQRSGSLHIDDGSTAHSKIASSHVIDLKPNESILLRAEADTGGVLNEGHYTFDLDTPATTNSPIEQGLHSIWIPAEAISPRSNAGCAELATTAAATSGRPDIRALAFDTSTDEHAQFTIAMPKMWNEGTITAAFYWTNASATSGTVAWGLQGISLSNDDAIDTAFGTAVVTSDTQTGTAKDVHISATSSAITIGGSPAAGDLTCFQVYRDVSADNLAEDALLLGIKIFYTIDAANDA